MTDEHDPDAQPMHDEAAEHEHPVEAPVDDFSDSASTEEAASTQESTGEAEDASSSMPEGRSRSMFPLMAGIAIILAVGGGIAYWQLGRSTGEGQSTIEQAMNTKTQMPKIDAAPAQVPPLAAAVAVPAPSDSTAAASSGTAAPAAPSDNVDATSYKQKVEETVPAIPAAAPVPATAEIPQAPTVPASNPDNEIAAPAVAAVPAPIPASAANTPPAVAAAISSTSTETIDKLSMRIDDLQKSLEQAHQQLADLASQPAASSGSTMLEERLNKIEQDLVQLQHQKAAAKPAVHKEHKEQKEASAVTKASAPVKAAAHHKKSKKSAAAHKAEKTSSKWVLRAATPSEAWVSSDATTSELRHIQLGDTLSGIGKVTAIRQSSKGWEIEGSEAILR